MHNHRVVDSSRERCHRLPVLAVPDIDSLAHERIDLPVPVPRQNACIPGHACVPQRLLFLVEEVEAEPWLTSGERLFDVLQEYLANLAGLIEVQKPACIIVDADIRSV